MKIKVTSRLHKRYFITNNAQVVTVRDNHFGPNYCLHQLDLGWMVEFFCWSMFLTRVVTRSIFSAWIIRLKNFLIWSNFYRCNIRLRLMWFWKKMNFLHILLSWINNMQKTHDLDLVTKINFGWCWILNVYIFHKQTASFLERIKTA